MQIWRGILFITLALGVVAGAHYYLWARLIRDTAVAAPWRHLGAGGMVLLALTLVAGPMLSRANLGGWSNAFIWTSYVWMGLAFLLLVLTGAVDLLRLVLATSERWLASGAPVPERREFMLRAGSLAASIGSMGMATAGFNQVTGGPTVKRVRVPLRRLPASMEGFTIAQISDLHVGPTIGRAYVERVVALCNAERPSLVAITGDLVDGSVSMLRHATAPLGELEATYGRYFVTGNHEYYSGADAWIGELRRLGITTLRNERVLIGTESEGFDLAGVDDFSAARVEPHHACDIPGALAGRPADRECVLLAHQPKAIYQACQHGAGLVLSGHTHGGQIWPFGYIVGLTQPYMAGLHNHQGTHIYVSCGTGYWGPPMRVGAPSEVTMLELVRA